MTPLNQLQVALTPAEPAQMRQISASKPQILTGEFPKNGFMAALTTLPEIPLLSKPGQIPGVPKFQVSNSEIGARLGAELVKIDPLVLTPEAARPVEQLVPVAFTQSELPAQTKIEVPQVANTGAEIPELGPEPIKIAPENSGEKSPELPIQIISPQIQQSGLQAPEPLQIGNQVSAPFTGYNSAANKEGQFSKVDPSITPLATQHMVGVIPDMKWPAPEPEFANPARKIQHEAINIGQRDTGLLPAEPVLKHSDPVGSLTPGLQASPQPGQIMQVDARPDRPEPAVVTAVQPPIATYDNRATVLEAVVKQAAKPSVSDHKQPVQPPYQGLAELHRPRAEPAVETISEVPAYIKVPENAVKQPNGFETKTTVLPFAMNPPPLAPAPKTAGIKASPDLVMDVGSAEKSDPVKQLLSPKLPFPEFSHPIAAPPQQPAQPQGTPASNSVTPVPITPAGAFSTDLTAHNLVGMDATVNNPALGTDTQARPINSTLTSPAQIPAAQLGKVVVQIAQAVISSSDRVVEITLHPAELGKLRMTLQSSETGMNVQILADRPETIELMRRNAHLLEAEFGELGYQDISFGFAQNSQNGNPDMQQDNVEPANEDPAQTGTDSANDALTRTVPPSETNPQSPGLDLRL